MAIADDDLGLDFDLEALREKYREEREKRLRDDGADQYIELSGKWASFNESDPYAEEVLEREGTVVLPHTEIDGARRGQGLGAILVQGVLDDVRPSGNKVVPACWYVAQFIDENPSYRDLLAA